MRSSGSKASPGPPGSGDEAPEEPVVMDQQNYFFVPHMLAVEAGRAVEFRNSDVANHGVTASSPEPENRFNVVTPQGGGSRRRFVASKSPVAIGCPIHVAMAAWVFVFDHPYHAVTDERGGFLLPPVPPGRYTLHVRHPDGGLRRQEEFVVRPGRPLASASSSTETTSRPEIGRTWAPLAEWPPRSADRDLRLLRAAPAGDPPR